jgi:exonuclease III
MSLKIATLNCCLGLKNKKYLIGNLILENEIELLCVQEIELVCGFPCDQLSLPDYCLEVEVNSVKSRVGLFIKNTVSYTRKFDLEGVDSHLIIVDIKAKTDLCIINIYRCFNPQEGISAKNKFISQLELINMATTPNTIVIGDFNVDYSKRFNVEYRLRDLFNCFDEILGDKNLVQMVNFPTWSRIVLNVYKDSILDHVYITDP